MRTIVALLVVLLCVACGSVDPGGARCEIGRSQPCACPGGAAGAQECSPAGVYGACRCGGTDGAAEAATDVASDAPGVDAPEATVDAASPPDVVPVDAPADSPEVDAAPDAPAEAGCASMTPGNCCGVACPVGAHVMAATCAVGRCGAVCAVGFGNCDGDVANGCEVDTSTSREHCGACGAACASGRLCRAGACVTPLRPCSVVTDCGTLRPGWEPSCQMGECVDVCPAGFADCDGNPLTGCEARLSNRANCGACGHACSGSCIMGGDGSYRCS